jgi:hypothetical protein
LNIYSTTGTQTKRRERSVPSASSSRDDTKDQMH